MIFIIPVYNEEENLREFLLLFSRVFNPDKDRAVFINDGSTDRSEEMILEFLQVSARDSIEVINLPRNRGLSRALEAGMTRALSYEDEFFPLVTADADGQHDLLEINRFKEIFERKKLDILIVSRQFSLYPMWKKLGNWMLSKLASVLLGERITDIESGFRIMNRKALKVILSNLVGFRYSIASEIVYISCMSGLKLQNEGRGRIRFYRSRTRILDVFINIALGVYHLRFPGKHRNKNRSIK